jgi:hypothetical protein
MAMQPLTESIDLDLEESNELAFKIRMEGAATSPAKVRLVCESEDVSYMFNGYGTTEPEVVQFTLPQLVGKLAEGTYHARVEVLVENRYFTPLSFDINFKKTMKVVAEAMQVVQKPRAQEIKVSVAPVQVSTKPAPETQVIRFEQRPVEKKVPVTEVKVEKRSIAGSLRDAYMKRKTPEPVNEAPEKKPIRRFYVSRDDD